MHSTQLRKSHIDQIRVSYGCLEGIHADEWLSNAVQAMYAPTQLLKKLCQWVPGSEGSGLCNMCKLLRVLATTLLTQSKWFINSGAAARLDQESHWEPESKPLPCVPPQFLKTIILNHTDVPPKYMLFLCQPVYWKISLCSILPTYRLERCFMHKTEGFFKNLFKITY